MIDLSKVEYRVVVVASDGTQYDVTDICSALGWSEGEKELAAKITCKLACVEVNGALVTDVVTLNTPIIVYASDGGGFQEMIRGNVTKLGLTESNGEFTLDIEAADEAQALRHTQEDYFFSPDSSSTSIIEKILTDHGVPHTIQITDAKHEKKVYRGKYLSDMIADVLKDLKEKGGGTYFLRAREGTIEILPRGTNEQIYHFDIDYNTVRVNDSFDSSDTVTKVKIVGKERTEGKQRIDGIVEGRTELGTRQVIYPRDDKTTLEEAETAAKKILEENGVKRKTTLEAPDVPFLRKGDRIRLRSSVGEGYFFVKSISHSVPQQTMRAELDYDKEYSKEKGLEDYELAITDESGSSNPP
ncbi:MAG: hypothetical protein IJG24_07860 [Selenomonadaceae bacterium]|nr:hypothetical protein [Selenomonadaceae bacterium]